MSDRANVFLVAAASALAGAKLQDVAKALLERRRGSVSRPDASSDRSHRSSAAIADGLVTPTKPKHATRTRTSIGSPDRSPIDVGKTPNARDDDRHLLLQYFTSSQLRSHFFLHVKSRLQYAHAFTAFRTPLSMTYLPPAPTANASAVAASPRSARTPTSAFFISLFSGSQVRGPWRVKARGREPR